MKKILFKKQWSRLPEWGIDSDERINYYIEYILYFDFKEGLRFSASVPNYSYCTRSPFKCLLKVLEYSVTGHGQYVRLEDRVRNLDLWNKL